MNFRNTEYYASYIASSYNHTERIAKAFNMDVRPLAWAFMFVAERCFEGTRTFSTQGIDKPSLNLFKMYAKMGYDEISFFSTGEVDVLAETQEQAETGEQATKQGLPTIQDISTKQAHPEISGMASRDDNGGVQVLVYSHHDDWDITQPSEVSLTINGLIGSEYTIKHYRIDDKHSNPYRAWQEEGSPDYPTKEQYDRIKSKDSLEMLSKPQKMISENGELILNFTLPTRAISLIELKP
jgi:xylan 1,4-beta-xylosidase